MVFAKPPVVWSQTQNYGYPKGTRGRNGHSVVGICYHIAQGSRGSVESWFRSPQSSASSHFLIAKDGTLVQFVAEEDAAWTQGDTQAVTWPLHDPSVNPNLVLIGIEHEGYYTDPWTEAMFEADVALTLYLCERFAIPPRRPHLLGHYELNGATRKFCPGPQFPWDRLLDEVQRRYARQLVPWMADAVSKGIAYDLTDGSRPMDLALRGEAMTILVRLLERLGVEPRGQDPGAVAPNAPPWMRPYVRKAIQYGITVGDRPLVEATRAEAMVMSIRSLDLIRTARGEEPPPTVGLNPVERARLEHISDGSRQGDEALRGEVVTMAVRVLEKFQG